MCTTYDIPFLGDVVFGRNVHSANTSRCLLWTMTQLNTGTPRLTDIACRVGLRLTQSHYIMTTIIAACECLYVNTTHHTHKPYVRQAETIHIHTLEHTHTHTCTHTHPSSSNNHMSQLSTEIGKHSCGAAPMCWRTSASLELGNLARQTLSTTLYDGGGGGGVLMVF